MKITISNSGGIGVNSDSVSVFTNVPAPVLISKLEHLTDVDTITGNQNKFLQNNSTGTAAVWTTLDLAPKVSRAGDTMTGMLVLPATAPTLGTHATNKTYVDGLKTAADTNANTKLPLAGGTLTGMITLPATAPTALQATTKQYVDDSILASKAESVSLAGDTMTGMLVLPATAPTLAQHATNKTYVDTAIATAQAQEVSKAGDTMTGLLVLSADPAVALGAATKQYVDTAKTAADTNANTKVSLAGSTMTGLLTLSGAPTLSNHAVTKTYADGLKTAADTNANTKLPLAGGTMTGALVLSADPAVALGAATKQYVDTAITAANTESVSKAGDTMTGMLTLPSTAPTALQATTKTYVDAAIATAQTQEVSKAGDTMTGPLVLSANPLSDLHAATKQYVDIAKTAADTNANTKLATTGGTMTGMINLPSTAPAPLQATTKTYVDAGDATRLPLAGGILTGALTLSGAPTVALHAATKAYVDSVVTAGGLPTSGGTMTGMITLPATAPTALQATTKTYVDSAITANVPTGVLFLAGGVMTGLLTLSGAPTLGNHATTKTYVDTAIAGVPTTDATKVPLAGGTMTGLLTLSGAPTASDHAATKAYVDAGVGSKMPIAGGTMTGALSIANNTAGAYALNVTNNVDGQTRITLGHPSTVAKQSSMVHYTAAVNGALAESLHLGVAGHSCVTMNVTEIKAHKKLVTIGGVSGVDSTNPYIELHKPGVLAGMWHIPATKEVVLSETGGNGVGTSNHVNFNLKDGTSYFNASKWSALKSHSYADQHGQWAPLTVDFGSGPGVSDWYPAFKARQAVASFGYTTDVELGILRSGNNSFGTACIRVGSGESASKTTQSAHEFRSNGDSFSPGLVQAGTGFRTTGSMTINSVSPTILFQDTDHLSAFCHVNSNMFYILRSGVANGTSWDGGPNGRHPMTMNLTSGDVVFSGGMYANSDRTLKENINPLTSSLYKVLQLQGVNYNMIPEEGKTEHTGVKCGFIAQEVQEIIPEVVMVQQDGKLAIDYASMVSYLTEATKEQQDQINELKDTVQKQAEYINMLKDLSDRMDELMATVRYRIAN